MSIKSQRGFSLVELLITMVIFVLVIVAASNIFLGVLNQFKQQSKIAETNIEGMVGLQMLKADIEQAGYGLPYDVNSATYAEAADDSATVTFNPTVYNDSGMLGNPPRALLTAANLTMTATSDVLVVKATNVTINDTAPKWAYISNNGSTNIISTWQNAAGTAITEENLRDTAPIDNVTVVGSLAGRSQKTLVTGGAFFTPFNLVDSPAYAPPSGSYETYLIYGITPGGTTPIMPFNRADYYVRTPGTMPTQCAPGTGILYKGTINHTDTVLGGSHSELPLLDCVAAMKVVLARDSNSDGVAETYSTSWPVGTVASDIRAQLKEIRIYILLHEGQRDPSFTYTAQGADLLLGVDHIGVRDPDAGLLLDYQVPDRSYRWKIYTMVITPYNLR